ncbi:YegP family protein [Frigoriglobus tundricola]|uniref:DUF1508 domain-containing protein n=1 Tax=Frigoriglobus tundricola TaxID=2774151 RepID=A0A6M5YJ05_9BACT|nr:DUF1508 domain-containing protein [Frigoriglobus tundricola]QJW94039.1 hypothetical protein FTUN_1558 [Frigoriglobus tundricola]
MRALFLAAGLTGLVLAVGFSVAPAQDKKGDAKKDAKAAEKVGTVEIYKDRSGEFRFRVKDVDGKVVAMPPKGYDTKEECQKVLDLIKVTLNTAKVTEVKDDKK